MQGDSASPAEQLQTEYIADEKALDGSHDAPEGSAWNIKIFNESGPARPYRSLVRSR